MRLLCLMVMLGTVGVVAIAKEPVLKSIFPVGAPVAAVIEAEVEGTLEPWPLAFWSDHPGLAVIPLEKKMRVAVHVGIKVPAGCYLLAAKNAEGISAPRWFMVGGLAEQMEQEPNDGYAEAGFITNLPVVVNGRLEKNNDIDHFRIGLKKGESLSARVSAHVLDSPVDAMLHLFDAQGRRVAFNHDGVSLDPWLVYTAEADGAFVLQLSGFVYPPKADVRLTGSKETVYRLTLKREREALRLPFPKLKRSQGIPGSIRTALTKPKMTFPFDAGKGDTLRFEVHAARLGYAMDPVLRILDDAGKEVARDDGEGREKLDIDYTWNVKKAGSYTAEITDLYRRTGEDLQFQLDTEWCLPQFTASVEDFALHIETGKTATLKIQCNRLFGETNRIAFVAEGLPPGVSASCPDAGKKSGPVTMTIAAEADCAPVQTAFKLFAYTPDDPVVRKVPVAVHLKGAATEHEKLAKPKRDRVWLTVR